MKWLGVAAVVAFVGLPAGSVNGAPSDGSQKPNILFVFADDMTWEALGHLDETIVETPHLDRLAEQGVSFRRAYNQGSWTGAVCIASRSMLNTGRFLWNAKDADMTDMRKRGQVWGTLMAQAGYETYMTGKWHVKGLSAKKTFDHTTHIRPGMPRLDGDRRSEGYNRPQKGKPDPWDPWDRDRGGFWKGGEHWSKVLAKDSVGFLEHAAKQDKPFFMYLAFNAPHDPRQSPKRFVEQYPRDEVRIPENYLPKYPYRKPMGSPWNLRDEKLAPMPRTKYAVRTHRREYYALIDHTDAQIGKIFDALERTGQAENTYIIFTADHGLAVGHHGLLGKQNLFEHSVRAPFIIAGPDLPAGRTLDERIYLHDAMPTALELAGLDVPDHVQFRSVLPLIEGERDEQYEAIYGGYRGHQRSVIDGRYKLILYPKAPKVLLFDLKNDPEEMHNLAEKPKYQSKVKALFNKLVEMQPKTGDGLDLKKKFPELAK
jgi:choline-sulfatase